MNLLLLGADGQVGQELRRSLQLLGIVTAWGREDLDLSQIDRIHREISAFNPDVIVNAAAYTAVDRAESEPELAHFINGKVPGELAKAAATTDSLLIHVSTDYVFSGDHSSPYPEDTATAPLSVYGHSKLAGELAIQNEHERHCIIRTAWVYGASGKGNFVKTMLRLGRERTELKIVADAVGSPTWAADLAEAITRCIPRLGPETYGTYHYTNSGVASWYDFAIAIFEEAQLIIAAHNLEPLAIEQVLPIPTADYPTPATRPFYSVLDTRKFTNAFLETPPPHWRQSLRRMLAAYLLETDSE